MELNPINNYKSMKNKYLIAIALFIGCQNNSNNAPKEYESHSIKFQTAKAGFEKVPYGSVYAIAYNSIGEVTNESETIYSSPFLEMVIEIHLKNGNIIDNTQIDPAPFIIPSYRKLLKGQFMPSDTKQFELSSPRLKKEYTKYPIEKVFIAYYLTGQDPLNNQKEIGGLIRKVDVTEAWNQFTKDFDEKTFSEKNINKAPAILNSILSKQEISKAKKPVAIFSPGRKRSIIMPQQVFAYSYIQLLDSLKLHNIKFSKGKELAEDEFVGYKLLTSSGEYILNKHNTIQAYSYNLEDNLNSVRTYFLNENAKIEVQEQGYCLLKYRQYHVQLNDLGDSVLVGLNRN